MGPFVEKLAVQWHTCTAMVNLVWPASRQLVDFLALLAVLVDTLENE